MKKVTYVLSFVAAVFLSVVSFFLYIKFSSQNHIPRKFGATYMTMDNPYFEALNSAIEEVIETNGDLLITRDPANIQEKQNRQILDMLDMGVDFIFINPVDLNGIIPVLKMCNKKNVPFIVIDTSIADGSLAVSVIQSDNYAAGRQIGYDICKKLKYANIVVLYDKGIDSTATRLQGFLDVLYESPLDYKFVYMASNTTLFQQSMGVMQQFLEDDVDFDVVFGSNDPAALGALAAIQKKHINKKLYVYGIDGSPEGKIKIEQGLMEGTVAQYPKIMGQKAAETAYRYLDGETVEHDITVPVTLITDGNIEKFNVLGWQ